MIQMKFEKKKKGKRWVGASLKLFLDCSLKRKVTYCSICNLMILADAQFHVSVFILI